MKIGFRVEVLLQYDPELFNIIKEVFPCQNQIINRCDQTVVSDDTEIRMNCEDVPSTPTSCSDDNENCRSWAASGECEANPDYMLEQAGFQIDPGLKIKKYIRARVFLKIKISVK